MRYTKSQRKHLENVRSPDWSRNISIPVPVKTIIQINGETQRRKKKTFFENINS
jgi:hypothetical protein